VFENSVVDLTLPGIGADVVLLWSDNKHWL